MKKVIWSIVLIIVIGLMAGCDKKGDNQDKITPSITPLPTGTIDQEELDEIEDMTEDDESDNTENVTGNGTDQKSYTVKDYFPFLSDTEYVYEGVGNEYAEYNMVIDYYDQDKNRMQIRTDNGGTVMLSIIEVNENKASVIYTRAEGYYRDNLLAAKSDKKQEEVLLMEPLREGTKWTLADGRKRYISQVDVEIDTPIVKYMTIEVTTESEDNGIIKEYYAPKVGLIKTVFEYQDTEITSTLSMINKDKPLEQLVEIYYPHQNGKLYVERKSISFSTNAITRIIFQEAMQEPLAKPEYQPLISENTTIHSMYLGEDEIVYVDFSKHLIDDMNAGAEFETLILQGITNSLGGYYGSKKVYLTVEGKPYESGHITLKPKETLKVDMDNIVR